MNRALRRMSIAVLVMFVLLLVSRSRRIDRELSRLKAMVEDREKA